jgi:predicted lactoylglutathione lyase
LKKREKKIHGKLERPEMKPVIIILIIFLLVTINCKQLSQPTAQHLNPGDYLQISLSVQDLDSSLLFYQKLGFEEINTSETAAVPWALISDGWKMFMMSQNPYPSPALTYYSKDLSWRIDSLKVEKISYEDVTNATDPSRTLLLIAPDSMSITLIKLDINKLPRPEDSSFTFLGEFKEISMPVNDLAASLGYWTRFGFSIIASGEEPLPWAMVSDQKLTLGFYETDLLAGIAFTYESKDVEKTLIDLKNREIPVFDVKLLPDNFRFGFSSPDGQIFYVRAKSDNQSSKTRIPFRKDLIAGF